MHDCSYNIYYSFFKIFLTKRQTSLTKKYFQYILFFFPVFKCIFKINFNSLSLIYLYNIVSNIVTQN